MKLAGDLAEFSLPDLLQVKGASGQTAGLRILGPEGNGLIVLREGAVVHAQYEELSGEAAFHALMGVKAGYFEAAGVEDPLQRTIDRPMRELLLDAFRLAELGQLPRPTLRARPSRSLEASREAEPASRASVAPEIRAAKPRRKIGLWVFGLGGALLLGAVVAAVLPLRGAGANATRPTTGISAAISTVLDVSALTSSGDRHPQLLAGDRPEAPKDRFAVSPTVICRIRIDATGAVVEAHIYRSRLEFADLEDQALRTLQSYRFRPALHNGSPVSVWMNYPVEFR
ncbi:MAG: TonB family protein [Thermoanaerobaculia bacterium]